jgi:glycosyltransferase involved in cell wall biosynthesis
MTELGDRTSHWRDWAAPLLAARKRDLGVTVSVVIPARNEEQTVGEVVSGIARLNAGTGLVDELVVMDSDSTDETFKEASRAGATVHRAESLPIPVGYGIELAVLLDTAARDGLGAIAQVDLGSRGHKHQASHDLAVMAAELLLVAKRRRTVPGLATSDSLPGQGRREVADSVRLHQFFRSDEGIQQRTRPVPVAERPPARSVER